MTFVIETDTAPSGILRTEWRSCPNCLCRELRDEWRNASMKDPLDPPPRRAYGHWIVCCRCSHEWPGISPSISELRHD